MCPRLLSHFAPLFYSSSSFLALFFPSIPSPIFGPWTFFSVICRTCRDLSRIGIRSRTKNKHCREKFPGEKPTANRENERHRIFGSEPLQSSEIYIPTWEQRGKQTLLENGSIENTTTFLRGGGRVPMEYFEPETWISSTSSWLGWSGTESVFPNHLLLFGTRNRFQRSPRWGCVVKSTRKNEIGE